MPIYCEQPAGAHHCPWCDNGYCHWDDEKEKEKRKLLAQVNSIEVLRGVCRQTWEAQGKQ